MAPPCPGPRPLLRLTGPLLSQVLLPTLYIDSPSPLLIFPNHLRLAPPCLRLLPFDPLLASQLAWGKSYFPRTSNPPSALTVPGSD